MFQPEFADPIVNISVAIGRDATFTCHVKHLGGYRVNFFMFNIKIKLSNILWFWHWLNWKLNRTWSSNKVNNFCTNESRLIELKKISGRMGESRYESHPSNSWSRHYTQSTSERISFGRQHMEFAHKICHWGGQR